MIEEFKPIDKVMSINDKKFLSLKDGRYETGDGYWESDYDIHYCNAAYWATVIQGKYAELSAAIKKHSKLIEKIIMGHGSSRMWCTDDLKKLESAGIPVELGRTIVTIVEDGKLDWILEQYRYYQKDVEAIKAENYKNLQSNTICQGENADGENVLVFRSSFGDGTIVQREMRNGKYEITRIGTDGKKETAISDEKEL